MNATRLRSQHDKEMFDQLLEHPVIKKVNERIARREGKGNLGIRRHLLSTSVRLTATMAGPLHAIADTCAQKLGLTIPLELYVFPSPTYNAACFKPEEGRLFVMFASSLLENFETGELKFVMGHELGHHLYNHHDLPIGQVLRGKTPPSPKLALALTSWSRFAEVSADRAGAYCANDLETVAHSLFKLASGLSGQLVRFSLEEFMQQVDEMQMEGSEPGQGAPTEDWFLTHPFSPLRVKALKLFDESVMSREGGTSVADLEAGVHELMGFMEPSYLEGRTDTAEIMRRLLFSGAITVADESDGISDAEIEVFESFFGNRSFSDKLDVEQIKNELPERISQARENTSRPQRMQVVQDLCTISRADGHTTEAEVNLLLEIGAKLQVPGTFITQILSAEPELD